MWSVGTQNVQGGGTAPTGADDFAGPGQTQPNSSGQFGVNQQNSLVMAPNTSGFQQQQSGTGFGQPSSAGFGQPQPSIAGFGQPQPPSAGFGQLQSSIAGFGQLQSSIAGFGQPQPPSAGFGQPQPPSAGFGQPQPSSAGFGQPQPSSAGFGQLQSSSAGFGQPKSAKEGHFGTRGTPSQAGFGASTPAQQITFGKCPSVDDKHPEPNKVMHKNEDVEKDIEYEEMKKQALQSMPQFSGGPPRQSSKSIAQTGRDPTNPEEASRLKDRENRFKAPSTVARDARRVEKMQSHQASDQSIPVLSRKAIVGTCEEMCPAAERERRQNMSDIKIFERVDPNNSSLTSPELAVKCFARTIDDPQPSDFRTRGALERTMNYLRDLLDNSSTQ